MDYIKKKILIKWIGIKNTKAKGHIGMKQTCNLDDDAAAEDDVGLCDDEAFRQQMLLILVTSDDTSNWFFIRI